MFTDMGALNFGGNPLVNLMNMPSEAIASQMAPMFSPGPGFQLPDALSALPLPGLQSLVENGGTGAATQQPGFDKILAGLAGISAAQQPKPIQAPQVQAAAAGKSSAIPAGPGDAIIAQLMQNILATQGQRQSIGQFAR